ncbi:MAG: DUF2064 domain-containing protein [Euryarchaeota archaeon]|nr:DUF2064 domain-containing protein [Euryarchaeota archaeon]MDE1835649.1 DUF2064 domain-containing protein [Euryarchaeota archaeon]MDE1878997.1 DUF2064 domain-containing protein [Euryarchaeota archaeon]MDE2043729.1 DUF2064 domain-containing protein [Thermoplasmata archaeon]
MSGRDGSVIVFARNPQRGRVKTRLSVELGEEGTLGLYRAFLRDTLQAARESGARVAIALTPGPRPPEAALADRVLWQRGVGFGERMDGALEDLHRTLPPGSPYVIVGADTPHLAPSRIARALRALRGSRVRSVLGPCQREGFYLLGFRGPPVPVRQAFKHPRERQEVVRILREAGRPPRMLPSFFDIDVPADLHRLSSQLRGRTSHRDRSWVPRATRDFLLELGWPGHERTRSSWREGLAAPVKALALTPHAGTRMIEESATPILGSKA